MDENRLCAFILTHGRPNRVLTVATLKKYGYTGDYYLIIDDEDKSLDEYLSLYGDKIVTFSKEKIAEDTDEGDNFKDRSGVIYARNASFNIARDLGYKYFIQLDDDYKYFTFRFNSNLEFGEWFVDSLDDVFRIMLDYFKSIPCLSLCVSQGGDHIGGVKSGINKSITAKRKAMNSFICSTDRPFKFFGRINEDTNVYTNLGFRGHIFLTINMVKLFQEHTQQADGGLTDIYLARGTYVKSFYSVMYTPSAVKVSEFGDAHDRLHHRVNWNATCPKIIHQDHRKSDQALQICAERPAAVTA